MTEKEKRIHELVEKYNDKTISDDEFRELIISCFSMSEDGKKVVNNPAFVKRVKAVIDRYRFSDNNMCNLSVGSNGFGVPMLYAVDSEENKLFVLSSDGHGAGALFFLHTPNSEVSFVSRRDGAFAVENYSMINGVYYYVDIIETDKYGVDVYRSQKRSNDLTQDVTSARAYELTTIIRQADPSKIDVRFNKYDEKGQNIMSRGQIVSFDSRDPFDVLSTRYTDIKYQLPDISKNADCSYESSPEQLEMMFASCTNDAARTELESRIDTVNAKK